MIRINLLPPELIEKRKYERFYPYLFVGAAVLIVAVVVVWFGLQLAVNQRSAVLQQTKTTTARLSAEADSFAVFERKQQELEARQKIADLALAGRIDMGRLAEDVSLVLPDEVFAIRLKCDQATGVELDGGASMSSAPSVKQGYRSVAATLVRLASIEQLYSVWLGNASVVSYTAFQPIARSAGASATAMTFSATSKIRIPVSAEPAE